MVIDRYRQRLFGLVLTNHVFVEERIDLFWFRQLKIFDNLSTLDALFVDDLVAEMHALVTDINARASDKFCYLLLRFATKVALEHVARVGWPSHAKKPT